MKDLILIADSGSTKTDWKLIDDKGQQHLFHTMGFNPYFQSTPAIYKEISLNLIPELVKLSLEGLNSDKLRIFFYGAGCSTPDKCGIVRDALRRAFPHAYVDVEHDLLAAARALCGKEKGIAAILGTGSNSCFYDGDHIVANVASLGFILGDEGSGAHIGKLFMQDYLNNEVPKEISERFYHSYRLNRDLILDSVYKESMPSRFLASFSKFIKENSTEPYVSQLIRNSFEQFFRKHICKYKEHRETALNCVGSVAYHYQETLKEVASEKGITIAKVIQAPMDDLTRFHLTR